MNASRAQLVREIIRPALDAGEIILCDRFYDSTTAYQGYGRQLDLKMVSEVVQMAVGDTKPDLTLLLAISPEISEMRRALRQSTMPFLRDRMEEADREFFTRVAKGYEAIAAAEPSRVRVVDASGSLESVCLKIWQHVQPLLPKAGRW